MKNKAMNEMAEQELDDIFDSDETVELEAVEDDAGEEVVTGTAVEDQEDGAAVEELHAQLAQAAKERDEANDQLLRLRAEFENYRKRTLRDGERLRKTATEKLIRELLPVADNLERALSHIEDRSTGLAQGVDMVLKQFFDAMQQNGLEPIEALGMPFDPQVHEALTHQPSEEYGADTVMHVFERGYRIGEFIIRPSKVVVSSGGASESDGSAASAGSTPADATE
ncbi:MAG: nucleotide exchange factor GrpE [Candidatus Hydrogenedentes bacterium]|nr:nucleotide exchange factor GrpE [Candidatus Hydrogenedentota bacterium]